MGMRASAVTKVLAVNGLAIAVSAGTAAGQDALNRPLDRNLQVGTGGANPARPDFAQEVRFRNAIITGNVPGGMSFRGNVGYTAPGELSAGLGSNDLFAFRRDSVYSGLGGLGIRGTDALQYQFAATTGNAPPPGVGMGLPVLRRSGAATTPAAIASAGPNGAGVAAYGSDFLSRESGSGGVIASLRSPAAFVASRDLKPSYLGTSVDEQGRVQALSVSPLRGISIDVLSEPATPPNVNTRDAALTGVPRDTAPAPRPGEKPEPEKPPPGADQPAALTAKPVDARVDDRIKTAASTRAPYEDLMDKVRQAQGVPPKGTTGATGATGPTGDTGKGMDKELADLREALRTGKRPAQDGVTAPSGPTAPTAPANAGDLFRPGGAAPGATGATGPTGRKGTPEPGRDDIATPEALKILRSTKERVNTLAAPGFDGYANAMKIGQEHLAGGRFFDAEERFTSALATRPGDPMAAAGRINAEIGAGMYLSAAINIRGLLVEHPEMTGAKYGPDLMPKADRIGVILDRLTEIVGERSDQSRDAALLLAFLGYQAGRQDSVRRGLDALSERVDPAKPDQLSRVAEMVRGVWIEGPGGEKPKPAPSGSPTPAPSPTPPPAPAPTSPTGKN